MRPYNERYYAMISPWKQALREDPNLIYNHKKYQERVKEIRSKKYNKKNGKTVQ